jgi:aminoglycoside phosphotransferase (APT) family kinase protein
LADRMMHADEVHTDVPLVRRLLAAQFPQWAELALRRVPSAGTDNALYRLGDDMVVRLPRIKWAVESLEREQRWLPWLAPRLPVAVPVLLGKGTPGFGYPWHWSVHRWLEGENPVVGAISDPASIAGDLAEFIAALQRVDPSNAPPAGRGVPLARRDAPTRAALKALDAMIDTDATTAAWEAALRIPDRPGPAVWLHGDLAPGNVLIVNGRLGAVIDWGCLGVGDPACELAVAWNLLPADTRAVFRTALGVDDSTWARGRGWALSIALVQLPYYKDTNPELAASARHVIGEVLADHQRV